MKIVVLDGFTLNPGDISWEGVRALGDLYVFDRTPAESIGDRIGDAEIVMTNKVQITRAVMKNSRVKYVGVLATGYNVVDVAAARELNITVTNIPTYGTNAVAQYTFALLLEACHHVGAHSASVHSGEWTANPDWCYWKYPLLELSGKTMGIIGFGKIGKAVGKIADAMGIRVLYYDQAGAADCGFARQVSMDELLTASDIVSLHCPLFESNRGMINRDTLRQMKDGVILINTSRGPLVNEKDLAEALESGKVAFAAVDVVSAEPIHADNPLLGSQNAIITPHIAWATRETRQRLMAIACENIRAFLAGAPINEVTYGNH